MADITETWASDPSAAITEPTVGQQNAGFVCGPADPGLFNWLFNKITACIVSFESRITALENVDGSPESSTLTMGTIN